MKVFIVLAFTLLFQASASADVSLTAPEGYTKRNCSVMDCSFFSPDGWHVFERVRQGIPEVYLTLENYEKSGDFSLGVIIQFEKNIESFKNLLLSYNKQMKAHGKILASSETYSGTIKKHSFLVFLEKQNVIMDLSLWSDSGSKDVYVLRTDAPASEWEKHFKIVSPILSNFSITGIK